MNTNERLNKLELAAKQAQSTISRLLTKIDVLENIVKEIDEFLKKDDSDEEMDVSQLKI